MRTLSILAGVAFAAGALAQSPLITLTGGTNQGNIGNNIYFDLQINQTITINQIVFRCGANTTASSNGGLTVYLGPSTYVGNTTVANAGLWTQVASVAGLAVAPSTNATATFSPGICLGPGNYGVALKSAGCNHGYTNGVTCTSTTIPGACSNSTFTRTEVVLRAGANQNYPWGNGNVANEGINTPRIFNGEIHYTLGGTPIAVAAWQPMGTGCYGIYHSFRELYGNPSTSFDLKAATGTNTLRMLFAGTGYQVQPFVTGTGTYYTPTAARTTLTIANNSTATVTPPFPILYPTQAGVQISNSLEVCDNGFISPAGTNGSAAVPTTSIFFNGAPRWAPAWFNFDPSLGGEISTELDPNGTQFYITWAGVRDVGLAASSNTFQVMFDNVGNVEYRYGAMSLQQGGTYPALAGWTPGSAALDPGDIDISGIATAFMTGPIDQHALRLTLSARPLLGTTPVFNVTEMEITQTIGGLLLGFVGIPGGLDLGFLGMPNCRQYIDLNSAIASLFITGPGGPGSVSFGIPNATSFNGVLLFGQAACFGTTQNSAFGMGVNASNGVQMVLGNL